MRRKTGDEPFHLSGCPVDSRLLDFWSWASSDLLSNSLRGLLAEYIVATALQLTQGVRVEWDAVDLKTNDHIRIEVKSAAYLQSWSQKSLSKIVFSIRPANGWNAAENAYSTTATRASDIYVFCLLAHEDKTTVDPLDLAQWRFFVVRTEIINTCCGKQKSIALSSLTQLPHIECRYQDLGKTLNSLGAPRCSQ
ncbi:MAG: hypothetical protein R3C01_03555 [Planctomycetaceae bacterium]